METSIVVFEEIEQILRSVLTEAGAADFRMLSGFGQSGVESVRSVTMTTVVKWISQIVERSVACPFLGRF